jgi:hypothetical protein
MVPLDNALKNKSLLVNKNLIQPSKGTKEKGYKKRLNLNVLAHEA